MKYEIYKTSKKSNPLKSFITGNKPNKIIFNVLSFNKSTGEMDEMVIPSYKKLNLIKNKKEINKVFLNKMLFTEFDESKMTKKEIKITRKYKSYQSKLKSSYKELKEKYPEKFV